VIIARAGVLAATLLVPAVCVGLWIQKADERLAEANATPPDPTDEVAVAASSNEGYCSPELKRILRRVLLSCGLMQEGGGGRGCQPVQAASVATLAGDDFNALFTPMKSRGGIIHFDKDASELDAADLALIDELYAAQGGASWFFVVARSSPEGSVDHNRDLSRARADAVMTHLRDTFKDPDLEHEVGLLWLGEEFAQLDQQFCDWRRSATDTCEPEDLNRSAFVAWIDCQL
jgi:outer membrane protein OmpA-like peptidoglycan-associated protein